MKYLLDNMKLNRTSIKKKLALVILLLTLSIQSFAQFPERPAQGSLVNDFADVLSPQRENQLLRQLSAFGSQTSTALILVTVPDLNGYDKAQYAVELAHQWEIGQKGKDNGILILVKPKTASSNGEAYIAVGYGLEAVVPDAIAQQIVTYEMIPEIKANDYFAGFAKASRNLMEITG